MMTTHIGPMLDAEIAYRQARIAHDHAAAAQWSHRIRRMAGGVRRLVDGSSTDAGKQRSRTVGTSPSRAAAR